jgi:uncharacterized protein (TIGR02996 family)
MTPDFHSLVKAVVENPKEDTPLSMLADHLTEGGDGRGEIIQRWLSGDRKSYVVRSAGPEAYHWQDVSSKPEHWFSTEVGLTQSNKPAFSVTVMGEKGFQSSGRHLTVPVELDDARRIADSLPHKDAVHSFLNHHFGEDERYAQKLGEALKSPAE